MVIIQADKVCKSYGASAVLKEASFKVAAGEKVGLIGRNGAGKTTLLRLIAGIETSDGGTMAVAKHVGIRRLDQDPHSESDKSLIESVYEGFRGLLEIRESMTRLSHEMSRAEAASSPGRLKQIMDRYAALTDEFERAGGYAMDSKVMGVLAGLGFAEEDHERPVGTFSGGEKTRIALARVLLSEPGVLLLDEPTNHLDIPATIWLEGFLVSYPGTVIVVSHDRHFLDRVVSSILEVEDGRVTTFRGNYSEYVEEKGRKLVELTSAYELQRKEVARLEAMLRRYTALSPRNDKFARRAEDVRKKLARIDRLDKPVLQRKSIGLSLREADRAGDQVLRLENVASQLGCRAIFQGVSLTIRRGEHVGLVGRNGIGKTTLLRIVAGQVEPDFGTVRIGNGVVTGYYDQQQRDLRPERTVLEEVLSATGLTPQEARDLLGRFLFRGDDVFKRVADLSGGERNRILLAKLMASRCNFLVMDEPTNHLDIDSIEALERALAAYEGTLLVVSHDRYFLERVTDRILELDDGRMADYPGGYTYYIEKKASLEAGHANEDELHADERSSDSAWCRGGRRGEGSETARARQAEAEGGQAGPDSADAIEREIMELEESIRQLNAELADLELYRYPERMAEKARALALAEKTLTESYRKWESLIGMS